MVSNQLNDLMRQRVAIIGEIKNIENDIAKMTRQIKEYQVRVERTPKHEQELLTLNRDYQNMQNSYSSLLNRKLEAEISVNMEKKQKGEQFRIVDHAALPRTPVSPDVRKLFLFSAAAGLGLGAGLIFLLDFLSTSLKHPKDYESELGLAVLATIPKLISPRGKRLRRLNGVLTFFSLIIVVGLAGVFGLFILKGVDPMLEIARGYAKSFNIPFI
jgi:capsular polysaccharide biosynthesis protein